MLGGAGLAFVLLRRVGLPLVLCHSLMSQDGASFTPSSDFRISPPASRLTLREVLAALFKIGLTRGELRIFSGKVI